jgi:hypothetical protein
MDTSSFATLIWIVLLFFYLVILNLIFFFLKISTPKEENEKSVNNKTAETDDHYVDTRNPVTLITDNTTVNDPEEGSSTLKVVAIERAPEFIDEYVVDPDKGPTKFGIKGSKEIVFNDISFHRFYSTSFDEHNLKVSVIFSKNGFQEDLAYHTPKETFLRDSKKTLVTNNSRECMFTLQTKTVPLAYATHVECDAIQLGHLPIIDHIIQSPTITMKEIMFVISTNFWNRFKSFINFMIRWFGLWMLIIFIGAVVLCFYIPGYREMSPDDTQNYNLAYSTTLSIFVLTSVVLIMHILYLIVTYRSKTVSPALWKWTLAALVFLLVCFAIGGVLVGVVTGAYGNGNSSSSSSSSSGGGTSDAGITDAAQKFGCMCLNPDNAAFLIADEGTPHPTTFPTRLPTFNPTHSPTYIPTHIPTATPTLSLKPTFLSAEPSPVPTTASPTYTVTSSPTTESLSYAFECTNNLYENANYNVCNMNCGVCASTYRNPFVAYTIMAALYLAIMMVIIHYELYFGSQIDWIPLRVDGIKTMVIKKENIYLKVKVNPVKITISDFIVKINGSKAFGFPVYTKMSATSFEWFEKHFTKLVEEQKVHRNGDAMYHYAKKT